ncbi:hypothetical protein GF325_12475, partial [Candidatus Bathyarchaeota archaeon]|nr:hypothetical protein [Candidatus Bathyarchaeota archaeon]
MIQKLKNGKTPSLVASMTLLIVVIAGSWPVNAQIRDSSIKPKQATSLDIVAYSSITADLARNIIGDAGEIDVIIEGSTDIHSYEPTATDIALVDDADIFLLMANKTATGIGLEGNYDQILSAVESSNPGLQVVFAVNDSTDATHGIIIEHDNLIDKDNPHVWMSPLNAINMTGRIFNAIHAAETNTSLQ